MREKELRLSLICYGGISLAVYMHGITKEIWRLARASRGFCDQETPVSGSESVYRSMLDTIETSTGIELRVLADIIAGASAGGINGIFLAQAIATGQSLEPLTDLWLESADVEKLLDPDARPNSTLTKFWASPLATMLSRREGDAIQSVDPETRAEVRAKLSSFVRARWFEPPFGGAGFTNLLLDAFDAMAASPPDAPLLPPGQPLDLFVTVTDFRGHPERLRLNSPAEVVETEHRLTLSFADRGDRTHAFADSAELVFAARATASFPGAFPPFTVAELDCVLESRDRAWPGRDAFLARSLPRHHAANAVDAAVLIDGSVLTNAPFRPAIEALKNRPARREIDRRFVYIDPKPGIRTVRFGTGKGGGTPGFFTTILGALSDIPRVQPIRDNLDAIEGRSARIMRTRRIIDSLQAEVEEAIETLFGRTFFLDKPTPVRLAAWRSKASTAAARQAGHAYAAYGHLKLSSIVEDIAALFAQIGPPADRSMRNAIRDSLWAGIGAFGVDRIATSGGGATPGAIIFFREQDLGFRIRRLRFLARRLQSIGDARAAPDESIEAMRSAIYETMALYLDRERPDFFGVELIAAVERLGADPAQAIRVLGDARDLKHVDDLADARIADALAGLPRDDRRAMLLAYLGFAFYDIATLSLMQGDGQGEFDPVKVDRISPDDAVAIRSGGAQATLKGVRFNTFGAFFSRAYRENDYLWGRLHGADRLIDIVVSTLPEGRTLDPGTVATAKRDAFLAILDEEEPRLKAIAELFRTLRTEIGA